MVFTNSGMAMPMGQNIGGARVPEPVGNYRCWSQMKINDWNTPEEQDKMTGDWGKDVAGRGKRSSLTVGDINGAFPKTYGGAWRFPGDREQTCKQAERQSPRGRTGYQESPSSLAAPFHDCA